MAVTEIILFDKRPSSNADASSTAVDSTIEKAVNSLKRVQTPEHLVLGTQIQNKGAVQIAAEWDGVQDYENFRNSEVFGSYIASLRSSFGEPQNVFHIAFSRSVFGPDGLATANVVEYAESWFPASRITPEFQKQIEEDFERFDGIFRKGANGGESWTSGWVLEEQDHEELKGEKAKCFLIARGWESMQHFEQSVTSDAFKEAAPILFAWNVPFKMWHVERKYINDL